LVQAKKLIQFEEFTLNGGFVDGSNGCRRHLLDALFNDPDFHAVDRQFFGDLKYSRALTDKASLQLKGFPQGYVHSADEANENGGPSYQSPLTALVPDILLSARLDTFSIDKLKIDH